MRSFTKATTIFALTALGLESLFVLARPHTQVIEKFSFDMDEMVYPRGYVTNG